MSTFGEIRLRLSKLPHGAGVDSIVLTGIVNDVYQRIIRSRSWSRLKELDATFQTVAIYETGTIAVTSGLTAITGTTTVWTTAMTGRRIRISGQNEYYTFTYVSGTSGTLDRAYEGDTDTGLSYKIFQNVYALASNATDVESMRVLGQDDDLGQVDIEDLDRMAAARLEYGEPVMYALYEDNSSGVLQVELYPIPDEVTGILYRYRKTISRFGVNDTSTSLLTWVSEECLIAGCEARLYELQGNPAMAQTKEGSFQVLLMDMQREDAHRTPGFQLRLDSRFTEHRASRARGHFSRIDRFWQLRNSD